MLSNISASPLLRMANGLSGPILGLGLVLSATAGCELDRRPIYGSSDGGMGGDGGTMVADGGGGMGDGGMGGDGGVGGDGGMSGGVVVGSQYAPSPLRPADSSSLPPTHAFFLWQNGEVPAGRTFENFEFCQTSGPSSEIDDDSLCPASALLTDFYQVVYPLTEDSTYRWKVRARYSGGYYSEWSAIRVFSTDHSLEASLPWDGSGTDISSGGHNATLQNGAGYTTGIDGQALQCDGINDYASLGGGLALPGPLTVSAWIYGNGTPTSADSGILNQGDLDYALTYHTNGRVYFYIGDGTNSVNALVSASAWHHVLGTFSGTTGANGLRLFVDGALGAQQASLFATTGAAGNLDVGRYLASYFNGRVDNVTIYNQALSDVAILNEYCATQAEGMTGPLPAACQP
ncbi:MAG TPA: LamG domain-containing protein [bacterium]|nr:LamG domain-containing protein [bacterium]